MDEYTRLLSLAVPVHDAPGPDLASRFDTFVKASRGLTAGQLAVKLALDLSKLRAAAGEVEPAPTEPQKEEGNFRKGHVFWKGLPVTIETAKGQMRRGKGYETLMHDHYGYVRGTEGADGDQVDVFLCEDDIDSDVVFVVNQKKEDGGFDEHKVILGTYSRDKAKEVYLRNYSPGWTGMGEVTPMTVDHFKWWLENADTSEELKNGYFAAPTNLKKAALDKGALDPANGMPVWGTPVELPTDAEAGEELSTGVGDEADAVKRADYAPRLVLVKRAEDDDSPFTIAVDLDGTLAEKEEPFSAKSIGEPRERAAYWLRLFHEAGARIIIFTVRGDTALVRKWLEKHDLPFDFINENPDQPEDGSGKVMADLYWDDRAVDASDLDATGPEVLARLFAHGRGGDDAKGGDAVTPNVSILISRTTILAAPDVLRALEAQRE